MSSLFTMGVQGFPSKPSFISVVSDSNLSGSTICPPSLCGSISFPRVFSGISFTEEYAANANGSWKLPPAYRPLGEKYGIFLSSSGPKILGQGQYGVVYEGYREEDGLKVAIKEISLSEDCRLQIDREVNALRRVAEHPHVLKCFDVIYSEDNAFAFIVTEFCNGGGLHDYMGRRPCNEDKARRLFTQLIDATEYIHRNGVVHRDLKAENIVVQDGDTLKIVDFGLSDLCSVNEKTSAPIPFNEICGTPDCMAPEVLRGNYRGPEADVWSLGVVLYEMLTGNSPFDAPSKMDKYKLIREGQYKCESPQFTALSSEARELISGIFTVKPQNRWTLQDVRESAWMKLGGTQSEDEASYSSVWATMPQRLNIHVPQTGKSSGRNARDRSAESNQPSCCTRGIKKLWQEFSSSSL